MVNAGSHNGPKVSQLSRRSSIPIPTVVRRIHLPGSGSGNPAPVSVRKCYVNSVQQDCTDNADLQSLPIQQENLTEQTRQDHLIGQSLSKRAQSESV